MNDGDGGDYFRRNVLRRYPEVPHYHGDSVRGLFVVGAILLIFAQSTGAELPLSTTGTAISAVILVVAAGITNPMQHRIHWFNALLALFGSLLFGTSAVDHYRAGASVFEFSFFYIEALALISLIALYLTTKTIRGLSTLKYSP